MADKITQGLLYGGVPCVRLAEATFASEGSTEITGFTRFNPGGTAADLVAVQSVLPTLGDSPDKEFSDYELRNKDVIRQEQTVTYYKASNGITLANADNPDSIELVFAFNTDQKIKLEKLKSDQTPVMIVYPGTNTVANGMPDAYIYLLGTIKSLAEGNDSMSDYTLSIEGTIEYTVAAAYLFSNFNTNLEFASAEFIGFGEDEGSGSTCTGLADALDLTDVMSGSIKTIKQAV